MIKKHFTLERAKSLGLRAEGREQRAKRRAEGTLVPGPCALYSMLHALRPKLYALCSMLLVLILFSSPILAEDADLGSPSPRNSESDRGHPAATEAVEKEDSAQPYERDDVYHQLELFSTALSYVLRYYYPTTDIDRSVKDLTEEELEEVMNGAIRGMLQGLGDRHSSYLSKTYRKREQEEFFYAKFGGLGIRILPSLDGFVSIVQPIDGTPAMKAGLRSGDKIIKVDGKSIENRAMDDVVDILRGEVGTDVTVTIVRQGKGMPFDVTITRGIIDYPSMANIMMEDQIGYIKLYPNFTAGTPEELRQALDKLKEEGMRALILDLRDNLGGTLASALEVADAFLPEGVIVSTDGKLDKFDSEYKAGKAVLCPVDMPLVVLVNKNSASGSEIVAGAIKDHKRGIIVGEKTFGKGLVQQRLPLNERGDKAVSVTISIYKTPSGDWIHKKGIEPDIKVEQPDIFDGVNDEMLVKLHRGEYVGKFVYDYLDKHPDQDDKEQLQCLEAKIPELTKTLTDNEIELSDKIVRLYVKATFARVKYIPNVDLENDLQLATAIEEVKKELMD